MNTLSCIDSSAKNNTNVCGKKAATHDLFQQSRLAYWRNEEGMPEESPDFSSGDALDLLEFYAGREQMREQRIQEQRRERQHYMRLQRALLRVVQAIQRADKKALRTHPGRSTKLCKVQKTPGLAAKTKTLADTNAAA